jgi:hypothetical protein
MKDLSVEELMRGIKMAIDSDAIDNQLARQALTNGFNELLKRHKNLERRIEVAKRILTMGHTIRERETMDALEGKYNHAYSSRRRKNEKD